MNNKENEWSQIKGLNYEASIGGEIRNIKTKRIIKQRVSTDGYYIVDIQVNKKSKTFKTHRLIAEIFLPIDLGRNEVDHINRIKTDNRLENLRWVTRNENMNNVDWSKAKRSLITIDKIESINKLLLSGMSVKDVYLKINKI